MMTKAVTPGGRAPPEAKRLTLHHEDGRWSELVTPGHVIAARLRSLQGSSSAAAALALLIGALLLMLPAPTATRTSTSASFSGTDAAAERVADALRGLPPLPINEATVRAMPPPDQMPAVRKAVLDALATSGRLPDLPQIELVEPEAFWREAWVPAKPVGVRRGDTLLVGMLVASSSVTGFASARRWVSLFKRRHGTWQALTLAVPGALTGAGTTADPADVALSLQPVLPAIVR